MRLENGKEPALRPSGGKAARVRQFKSKGPKVEPRKGLEEQKEAQCS